MNETTAWAKAATSIDSFIGTLSSMCQNTVAKLHGADKALGDAVTLPHAPKHRDYAY